MGPARLTSPITAAELTDMEVMSVEVKNLGLETQTNFSVGYQIEGAAPVIEAVTFVLDSDSSYIHTFQTTEDFSTVEDYNIKLFTTLQDDSNLINDTLRVVVSNLPRFDASISGFENLEFTNCGNEISFQATIVNLGQENLTQATINNQVNGITTSAQIWTGNLDPGESVNYTVTFSGLSNGSSTLGVSTSNPNGMADERPANDGFSQDVTMLVNGVAVFLELRTDVFPEETTWEVEDEGGNVVFSGGPYTDQITVYTEEWCLDSEGCYDFYIYDGFGDGISDQGVIGDYNILDADGNLLANLINPNFGDFEVNAFCAPQVACNVSTNFNVSSVSEEGVADGMIMVSPISGIAPFTYSIDGGATFQDENVFGGLVAGEYTILTQDDNDCTFEETVAIETCALMASATVTNETITGEEDGKIIFSASNGTPFYNYFFDGDTEGTTSPVFNNLAAGTYEITIVDAEGCEVKDQVVVDYEILEGVDDVVLGHQITVAPNPTEGVFRIDVKGMETNSEVFLYLQVYDAAGKRIQNNNLVRYNDTYTGQLSLVAWPAGIYYVRFMDANIQDLVRVVKN